MAKKNFFRSDGIVYRSEIAEVRRHYDDFHHRLNVLFRFYTGFCSIAQVTDVNDYIQDIKQRMQNLDKVKQQWHEQNKVNMKDNNHWLSQLQDIKFPGSDPKYFIDYEKYVNALTIKSIQDAAKLLLNGSNVITAVLWPEKK